MKSPHPKTRAEAWRAWEAALVSRCKITRPKTTFWKRWDKTFLNMFQVVSFKQYNGDIVYLSGGKEHTRNLMEGPDNSWNRNSFFGADVRPEFGEFGSASQFVKVSRRVAYDDKTFNNAMLVADWPALRDVQRIRSHGGYSNRAMERNKNWVSDAPDMWICPMWTTAGFKDQLLDRNTSQELYVLGDIRANSLQGIVTGHLETGVWTK